VGGISKTEVGDSLDLLLGELAALGFCQPDGSFIATLADLRQWLAEMARSGEAVCLDGLATRVQYPADEPARRSWTTASGTPTAQGLALSTVWGDPLWCDGAGLADCHEQELLARSGLDQVLDASSGARGGSGTKLAKRLHGRSRKWRSATTSARSRARSATVTQPMPSAWRS
jgi:hypothetical protein